MLRKALSILKTDDTLFNESTEAKWDDEKNLICDCNPFRVILLVLVHKRKQKIGTAQ